MSRPNNNLLAGVRILIVEDNLLIAMEIEQTFQSYGAEITICLSVAEALAALDGTIFDFVLSDYAVDGESVLPLLTLAGTRGIPAALLTGYSAEHIDQAFASFKIFEKPFRERDIIAHIAQAGD